MGDQTYLLWVAVSLIISIVIAREVFSIPRIVNHLRAQTTLLVMIAEKIGIDPDEARKQYFTAEGQGYRPIGKKSAEKKESESNIK